MLKVISPAAHAAIDVLLVGTLLLGGSLLWNRNRWAAVAALVVGGSGLGTILAAGLWGKFGNRRLRDPRNRGGWEPLGIGA